MPLKIWFGEGACKKVFAGGGLIFNRGLIVFQRGMGLTRKGGENMEEEIVTPKDTMVCKTYVKT